MSIKALEQSFTSKVIIRKLLYFPMVKLCKYASTHKQKMKSQHMGVIPMYGVETLLTNVLQP